MTEIWAEVIGDPVEYSVSPLIQGHWLRALGLAGRYRATCVERGSLAAFIAERRAEPPWRGCNVTAPHKESVTSLLDRVDADAAAVGAVNCVYRDEGGLAGANTDIDGIGEALAGLDVAGRRSVVIGGGGAARAVIHWLRSRGAGEVVLVLRRAEAAAALPPSRAIPFKDAGAAIRAAHLIVNATPLGLEGGEAMPGAVLDALARADGAAAFDMVYHPLETPFLAAARAGGLRTINGLAMLIGQARRSFHLLFGTKPPPDNGLQLRRLLDASMDRPGLSGRDPD